jgi:hypothetical protein
MEFFGIGSKDWLPFNVTSSLIQTQKLSPKKRKNIEPNPHTLI